jgi:hypothetical protein
MAAKVADAVALLGEPAAELPSSEALPDVRGVVVDSDARLASWRDQSVALAPLEHDLLVRLLESVGHTLTFEESPLVIHAVRGVGLRLVEGPAQVRVVKHA